LLLSVGLLNKVGNKINSTYINGGNEMDQFINVARRWYEKSSHYNDSFDQFISIWISFNAIYGSINYGREYEKIKQTLNQLTKEQINEIMKLQEVNYFCNIHPAIGYENDEGQYLTNDRAQNNLNRYKTSNPKEALKELLFIINKVRNNLFHGSKNVDRSRDTKIVSNAYPIVRKIVQHILNIEFEDQSKQNEASHEDDLAAIETESTSINELLREIYQNSNQTSERLKSIINQMHTEIRGRNHPVSIMLNFDYIGQLLFPKEPLNQNTIDQFLRGLEQDLMNNKTQEQQDIEEVSQFVNKVKKLDGAEESIVKQTYGDFIKMQQKFSKKGYDIHL
jgi:hypothetical protein